MIPPNKREGIDYQFKTLNGKLLVPFENMKNRPADIMLVDHPIPHDRRFEKVYGNLETLSHHQHQNVPTIKKYSPRHTLFKVKEH